MTGLHQTPAWQALLAHKPAAGGSALTATTGDIIADLSRQPADAATWTLLHDLAAQEDVAGACTRLFASAIVNSTEGRAAEHWALRAEKLRTDMAAVDARLAKLVDDIRTGTWFGATGQRIKTVVNIGIGGSDLGPRLIVDALDRTTDIDIRFITNIDPDAALRALAGLDAASTLFIIASKSFGTLETTENAHTCRNWLHMQLGDKARTDQHFVAVTSNAKAAAEFGISADNCFDFPDTIGGRYSLWGPVGLAARIAIGNVHWAQLLGGARTIDTHFQTAPAAQNLPLLLALASIWHINFLGCHTHAVLPYADRLARLPDYLQQLVMESNGKSVTHDGQPIAHATAPVTFGAAGTTGQHSFYQLLHQGTVVVPSDIIIAQSNTAQPGSDAQDWLVAAGLAQADALWLGRADPALPPHRQFAGRRPVTLLTLPAITPATLGQLLALYEHKTFAQSVIWRINAFDQWGVELGKQLAAQTYARMQNGAK